MQFLAFSFKTFAYLLSSAKIFAEVQNTNIVYFVVMVIKYLAGSMLVFLRNMCIFTYMSFLHLPSIVRGITLFKKNEVEINVDRNL